MMDWTDRHCRYFLRGFSPHTLLYTEMITAATRGLRRHRPMDLGPGDLDVLERAWAVSSQPARLGFIGGRTCPDKRKSRGPGGPRLGWSLLGPSAPASYLVVGTPLPRTRPETGAIVGA